MNRVCCTEDVIYQVEVKDDSGQKEFILDVQRVHSRNAGTNVLRHLGYENIIWVKRKVGCLEEHNLPI